MARDDGAGSHVGGAGVGVVAAQFQDGLAILGQATAARDRAGQHDRGGVTAPTDIEGTAGRTQHDGVVDGHRGGVVGQRATVERQRAGGQVIVALYLQGAAGDGNAT
ncbi:hypothetical protein D9M70_187760 [compost metagenome]